MAILGFLASRERRCAAAPRRETKRLRSAGSASAGFTVIEMVVSAGIMTFLLGTIIVSGSAARREFALTRAEQSIRGLLTHAKSLSTGTAGEGGLVRSFVSVCGYGVRVEANEAFVWRREALAKRACDVSTLGFAYQKLPSTYSDTRLEGDLNAVRVGSSLAVEHRPFDVLFVPPDPTTLIIEGASERRTEATIVIRARDGSESARRVSVNSFGRIGVERGDLSQ